MATRSTVYWFLVYPDSAPEDWIKKLEAKVIPTVISPLHAPDPNDEYEYKPHYHVLFRYDSLKSECQADEYCKIAKGVRLEVCNVPKACYRYLFHLDQPEKPQYSVDDAIFLNGFDPKEANKPTDTQIYAMIKEIVKYVAENNICYYIDLLLMCMFDDQAPPDWGYTVAHNTTLFSGACESLRKKNRGL